MHLVSAFGFWICRWFFFLLNLPDKNNIKVSCSQIKALILSCGQTEAHSEDRQGQGEQSSKDKQDSPYGETGRYKANC